MKELNREELSAWLNKCWSLFNTSQNEFELQKQAYKQIAQLISQSETQVDEEYIKEKARELAEIFRSPKRVELFKAVINTEYFIRSIVQEIQKPKE